ncbi:MAG TPA: DNA topoisomerase I [Candidatus Paceibacterota bacterium]|nr:DNA topoisomerase I [Candidatus Paceibacterota bacterium]
MTKKPKKFRGEKIAEEYFPVNEDDLKYSIEKEENLSQNLLKKTVEKMYNKPNSALLEKKEKKQSKSKAQNISYYIPNISLKDNGYELIITEKPQAALKIADALGEKIQKNINKVPYYEVNRDGKNIIVACAVGHLFTLKQNSPGQNIPTFDISWIPNYIARKKDFTKRYYDVLLKLAKNAGSLTVATDYDIEGEVIGLNIIRFICNQKDANRMKFSTLTKPELNTAYEEKTSSINWGQAIAGETRHFLDWFYGINLSRALMDAVKTTGKFRIMSVGRVQGPTLNLIVQKEKKIQEFKSQPFWQVFITVESPKLELKYSKNIFNQEELENFKDFTGKTAKAKTIQREQILPPNPPFNLTTLQTEAYKFYGLTPSRTLQIAQSLYLSSLISYPRTSSQKLPISIGYKDILKKLAIRYKVTKLIKKNKPIEGKKSDSAHPSIYPTGNFQILSGDDEKIYNLIVKRFLSLFCEDAIIDNKKVSATINNLIFNISGSEIRKKAWMEIYPSKLRETEIPSLEGEVKIIDSRTEEKETQPPKRYSPASIISELEKRNLGTKATRASILETLYSRDYIKNKNIQATPLGLSLISTLEKFSPIITDQELTRSFEQQMDSIVKAKKDYVEKEQKIIESAKRTIIKIFKDLEKNKKEIGKELLSANVQFREQQKEENKIHPCPVCQKGNLAITYSKKTKRHFIACDAYPDCKTTYSLPPNGTIKKTTKICDKCGFPMLMCLKARRKPWFFCFNSQCESNKERIEKYRKKQETIQNNE